MTTSIPRSRPSRRPEPTDRPESTRRPRSTGRPGSPQQPTSTGQPASTWQPASTGPAAIVRVKRIFAAETGNYFLLLGATLFLVVFGLVMVLSSSSVEDFKTGGDSFSGFVRQVIFAALGLPVMFLAARMRLAFWRRWAGVFMMVAIGLQLLVFVPHLGKAVNGNRNWVAIAGVTFQPSELIKVALVVWLALTLAKKGDRIHEWRELVIPIVPVAGTAIGLVLLGGDFGTSVILAAIVMGALFFAGVKFKFFALPLVLLGIVGAILVFGRSSRQGRFTAFLNGCSTDTTDTCWQTVHGWWALASGSIFGVGLGNSSLKWSWLPEANNDFIFAIIGEELGLVGAVLVLVLFVVVAVTFVRIIRSSTDVFARVATSAVLIWIIGQAFVNIAVVLGLLPVLGVPLPLISSGGTALITSLLAIGIVLSFARSAPTKFEQPVPAGRRR
jgi:cell division protein FtsW